MEISPPEIFAARNICPVEISPRWIYTARNTYFISFINDGSFVFIKEIKLEN